MIDQPHTSTLRLTTPPPDSHHQPREHQAVEILRSAAYLAEDEYVAANSGWVAKVARAYDMDSREVVIGTELPPEYLKKPGQGLPLYLRVWEGEFRCEPGEEHQLGHTGIRVRLTGSEDEHGHRYPVGAYWMVALRPGVGPGAPGLVYPQRILERPQPPDGPRQWLTPIAFVRWHPRPAEAEDCVPRFAGLVRDERSSGSCTVRIRPHDVGGGWALQEAINAYASPDHPATICLEPGTYVLPRPLRIGPEHGRLTLRATRPGVILRTDPAATRRFLLGMIIATEADGFALQGLEIHPAHEPFGFHREIYLNQPERAHIVLDAHRSWMVSIGLHASRCTGLSVEDCRFIFSLPQERDRDEHPLGDDLFGAAIFATEELRGLRVARCTFTTREPISHARRRPGSGEAAEGRHHVALGFVQVPTAMAVPRPEPGHREDGKPRGSISVPLLGDAVFECNSFEGLTAPLVAMGQLGELRLERNTVRDCHAGFWLVTQYASHILTLLDRLVNQVGDAYRDLQRAHLTALTEPLLFHVTMLGRALPILLADDPEQAPVPRHLEPPSTTDERHASELLHQLSTPDSSDSPDEPALAPNQRETRVRRFLETFGRARETRGQPEEVAVSPRAALRCHLSISGNVVNTGDAPGLVVLDTAPESDSSVILNANHLRSEHRPGATACLFLLRSCVAAANLIVNATSEAEFGASLIVLAGRHHGRRQTAVTGNVLVGFAHMPHRPDNLPSWESLNSVTRQ